MYELRLATQPCYIATQVSTTWFLSGDSKHNSTDSREVFPLI